MRICANPECQRNFQPIQKNQLYCSRKCRWKVYNRSNPVLRFNRRRQALLEGPLGACNAVVTTPPPGRKGSGSGKQPRNVSRPILWEKNGAFLPARQAGARGVMRVRESDNVVTLFRLAPPS